MTSQPASPRWSLAPGVFYRPAGPHVYVRNVATRYDYLFNPMVKDILDLLRTERTKDELLAELAKTYAIKNSPNFPAKLVSFLDSMERKGLLLVHNPVRESSPPLSNAEGRAKDWYQTNHRLWNASFELTYLCNERCRHCYLDDHGYNQSIGILRYPVLARVIDEFADLGCMNALVTGGEPTLHPDFLEICRHVVDRGMLLDLFTNALDIPDALFDAIVALHPNTVSFSLYGGTPEFHDSITQVPGSFERSMRNILMFKCAGVDVYVKSSIFKGRLDEYLKLDAWGKRVGIPVHCGQVITQGNAGSSRDEFNADPETLRRYLAAESKNRSFWSAKEVPRRDPDSVVCAVGLSTLTTRPNGNISPCISYSTVLGNVSRDSIEDIWLHSPELNRLRGLKFRDVSPDCATCPDSGFCSVCIGIAHAESGKLGPCSYSCWHAKLKHELFDSRVLDHAPAASCPLSASFPGSGEPGNSTTTPAKREMP